MSKKADAGGKARKTATNRALQRMDPDEIYFTHARVRPVFTGCNKRIQETLDEIVAGTTTVDDIPYITVIENHEAVVSADTKKAPKKKGRRRGADDSDSDDNGIGLGRGGETRPFYFSLNNRRLFLFKTLKSMGVVKTIPVQVKPALDREKVKYTRERCVLRAKLMGAGQKPVGADGDEEEDEDVDEDEA